MKRLIVIASHNHMASGVQSTLEFIAGKQKNVKAIDENTEVVVFTDMMAGSVNQKFFPYRTRPHTHIITGMNLPAVLAVAMESTDEYISIDTIHKIINESRQALQYVNEFSSDDDEEDE